MTQIGQGARQVVETKAAFDAQKQAVDSARELMVLFGQTMATALLQGKKYG